MQIRPATIEDAPDIARLATALGYASSAEDIASRLDRLLGRHDQFIVVADDDNGVLGWIQAERRLSVESGEKAEIVGLIVGQESHRRGVGGALVNAAEVWARHHGLRKMVVRSNEARVASHPFYEAQAFERSKTQHVYEKTLKPDRE